MKDHSKCFFLITIEDIKEIVKTTISEVNQNQNLENSKEPESLMTIEEVTELFQISKVTLHAWKKQGLIPFYRMGRRVYFKRSEVMGAVDKK